MHAYEEHSKGKKTLIFNNGINTSLHVYDAFNYAGYPVRHLDNTATKKQRQEILRVVSRNTRCYFNICKYFNYRF